MGLRSVAGLCIVTLLVPGRLLAAPPESEGEALVSGDVPSDPVADADWAEAERLFRQGSARYAAADYAAAIEAFQAALELVLKHDFDPAVELGLLVNLARAHGRAYEVDRDLMHLRTALEIYRRIERGGEGVEQEEAAEAIPKLEQRIAEAEAAAAKPVPEPEPVDEPEPERRKPGTGLIIGGGVGLALGLGGLGLMTYGMISGNAAENEGEDLAEVGIATEAQIDDIDDRGKLGNTLAIVGGVVGGVGVAVGAALIALGVTKNRKAASTRAMLLPYGTRTAAGMNLEMRF